MDSNVEGQSVSPNDAKPNVSGSATDDDCIIDPNSVNYNPYEDKC